MAEVNEPPRRPARNLPRHPTGSRIDGDSTGEAAVVENALVRAAGMTAEDFEAREWSARDHLADWLNVNRHQLEVSSPCDEIPADTCVATPCGSS